jgi:hypothetical protein
MPRYHSRVLKRIRTWWNFRKAVISAGDASAAPLRGDKDVVLLPCWRRPEFLWHCLDNIALAEGSAALHLIVSPDTGYSPDILQVVSSFSDRLPNCEIRFPPSAPYRRTKQSANLLLGYLQAASLSHRFVFLIEEDIMVARDFFRWHRAAHAAAGKPFCSIAATNPNRTLTLPSEPDGYYLSNGDYCSSGVCFDAQVLRTLIAPHIRMSYFRRPKKYIARHFPASTIGLGFVEQDGLIRRIQEQSTYPIAWPCVPRAFHAGFYGYNRPGGIDGPLQQRIRHLGDTIYDVDSMRAAAGRPEFIETSLPCELRTPEWKALRRIPIPDQPGSTAAIPDP